MKTFHKGGVHPCEQKSSTRGSPIERITIPEFLCVSLSQHIGSPSLTKVKAGDHVLKGQMIAEPSGFISVSQHSPVSGVIERIEPIQSVTGKKVEHIVIKNDFQDRWCDGINQQRDWRRLSEGELRQSIIDAGIVGLGGAAFPTHVKLSPPKDKNIDVIILNGAECEPYLTADHALMLERPNQIVEGLLIMMKIMGVEKGIIGIEANKKDAYLRIKEAVQIDNRISVELLKVKYPQGGEKQLIKSLLNREVPSGGLPFDVGLVVQNVATSFAVWEGCALKKPLIERVVTVTGDGVEAPKNLMVPIGMRIRDILKGRGLKIGVKKFMLGGPMMGVAIGNLEIPFTKGISGILAFKDFEALEIGPCIRCGRCVNACPMGLSPVEIALAVDMGHVEKLQGLNISDCMECSCCGYICPSRRQLVQSLKEGKMIIANKREK